jgi:hypothetical protein
MMSSIGSAISRLLLTSHTWFDAVRPGSLCSPRPSRCVAPFVALALSGVASVGNVERRTLHDAALKVTCPPGSAVPRRWLQSRRPLASATDSALGARLSRTEPRHIMRAKPGPAGSTKRRVDGAERALRKVGSFTRVVATQGELVGTGGPIPVATNTRSPHVEARQPSTSS